MVNLSQQTANKTLKFRNSLSSAHFCLEISWFYSSQAPSFCIQLASIWLQLLLLLGGREPTTLVAESYPVNSAEGNECTPSRGPAQLFPGKAGSSNCDEVWCGQDLKGGFQRLRHSPTFWSPPAKKRSPLVLCPHSCLDLAAWAAVSWSSSRASNCKRHFFSTCSHGLLRQPCPHNKSRVPENTGPRSAFGGAGDYCIHFRVGHTHVNSF